MNSIRDLWRVRFGRWWWLTFNDGSCLGPMSHARAHRWAYDSPIPYSVEWSRKVPCENPEDST